MESQAEEEARGTGWSMGRCGSSLWGADSPGEERLALLGWQLVSSGKEPDVRAAPDLDLICPVCSEARGLQLGSEAAAGFEAAAGVRGFPGIPRQLGSSRWGLLSLEGGIQATVDLPCLILRQPLSQPAPPIVSSESSPPVRGVPFLSSSPLQLILPLGQPLLSALGTPHLCTHTLHSKHASVLTSLGYWLHREAVLLRVG